MCLKQPFTLLTSQIHALFSNFVFKSLLVPILLQHPQHRVSDIGSGSEAFSIPVFSMLFVLLTGVTQLQMDYQ